MVTVYYVSSSRFGGGYWTTDRRIVDDEIQTDQHENDGASGFRVTERELSDDEYAQLEAKTGDREFMGW